MRCFIISCVKNNFVSIIFIIKLLCCIMIEDERRQTIEQMVLISILTPDILPQTTGVMNYFQCLYESYLKGLRNVFNAPTGNRLNLEWGQNRVKSQTSIHSLGEIGFTKRGELRDTRL